MGEIGKNHEDIVLYNKMSEKGKKMLQVMADRQSTGAECLYPDDLEIAVPSNTHGFEIVGGFLVDGVNYGFLELVTTDKKRGNGYRIVPEKLDRVRSMWQM